MSKKAKIYIITLSFLSIYLYVVVGQSMNSGYFLFVYILINISVIVEFWTELKYDLEISLKILAFTFFMVNFVVFERTIVDNFLCGVDSYAHGYLYKIGIVKDYYICSDFVFYDKLIKNFISSLYYPIYIFIFIKPFVNHLSNSIDKIKKKQ